MDLRNGDLVANPNGCDAQIVAAIDRAVFTGKSDDPTKHWVLGESEKVRCFFNNAIVDQVERVL